MLEGLAKQTCSNRLSRQLINGIGGKNKRMKAIRTEAQLTSFRSRSDGSIGFSGVTPEMSSAEKVALFELHNVLVEILVYPKDSKDSEVVEIHKEMEGKRPCQRLRGVLFVLWKKEGEKG